MATIETMATSTFYASLSAGLVMFLLCPTRRLSPPLRGLLLAAVLALVTLPIGEFSFAVAWRGAAGDLSIITLCWLVCAATDRIRPGSTPLADDRQRLFAAAAIVAAAVFLYPAGMGLSQWDPYRLGYGFSLLGATLAVAVAAYYLRQQFTLLALAAALGGYALLALESRNLWDYLIDPAIAFYALAVLVRGASRKWRTGTAQHR